MTTNIQEFMNSKYGGASIADWLSLVLPILLTLALSARVLLKAGYSWTWCFVLLIPVANVLMFIVFAFSDWPALRRSENSNNDDDNRLTNRTLAGLQKAPAWPGRRWRQSESE